MECRKQLSQVTAVSRDFKAKNKTGENLVQSDRLLSIPVIVKQSAQEQRIKEQARRCPTFQESL